MHAYDFILVLLSFVYAAAVTHGVTPDRERAMSYVKQAADDGYQRAIDELARLGAVSNK